MLKLYDKTSRMKRLLSILCIHFAKDFHYIIDSVWALFSDFRTIGKNLIFRYRDILCIDRKIFKD